MITIKHTHIQHGAEYNIYEEADKSVTVSCPTDGRDINITKGALSEFICALSNIQRSQDHDW